MRVSGFRLLVQLSMWGFAAEGFGFRLLGLGLGFRGSVTVIVVFLLKRQYLDQR